MAKMFPPDIELIDCTESEKVFYYALKEQLPDRISVFHSVQWYTQKDGRRENSESDFLIYDPDLGFITIEVKGGKRIRKDDNQWTLVLNGEAERLLKRSPFKQAEESMWFFKNYYREQYSRVFNGIFGYACSFPFYNVENNFGPEAPSELIIDFSDMDKLAARINRLLHYWGGLRSGNTYLVQDVNDKFLDMINRRISIATISGAALQQQERKLLVLNKVQDNFLDFIDNYSNAFIVGGAGTGKTWLAMKKAIKLSQQEKKVILLCFNNQLSKFMRDQLVDFDNISCMTFWQLVGSIIEPDTFNDLKRHKDLPGIFDVFGSLPNLPKYDAIIVDEAQDFTEEWALSVRLLLKSEIDSVLYVFHDTEQNIFKRDSKNGFMIENPPFLLRENLRNTATNLEWIKEHTNFGKYTLSNNIHGVKPVKSVFSRKRDAFQRVEALLKNLIRKELVPSQSITILSNRKIDNSILAGKTEIGPFRITHDSNSQEDTISLHTIQGFKGLESDVVIYLYHTKSNNDFENKELEYVAYTRAKFLLYVIEYIED